MNREQAIEFDNKIKTFANELSEKYNSPIGGDFLCDEVVTIVPETSKQGLITINNNIGVSIKPENIKFDLKKALAAGLELLVSISMPQNMFNYIQLLLATIIFGTKATTIEIGKEEAAIVYWLHKNDYYEIGIEEGRLIENLKEFLEEKEMSVSKKEIQEKINSLYKNKIIRIEEGNIYLNEKVIATV